MTISNFLIDFKSKSDEITFLSIEHMLLKLFKVEDEAKDLDDLLSNYPAYLRYLNDFASKIYKKYDSSIDHIYYETCKILGLEPDNKYLFDYRLSKLELNDVSRIMSITNDDIKAQTVEKQYSELEKLLNSKYYKDNIDTYKVNTSIIQKNLELLRQIVV
ncbi:MAG: hypothetical protein M0P43_07950 [Arcobacteraceae bacterium]|nr:hypothetical protein [Arcobacteraceae bacterium]MDY0328156.1 hypothetical protein [Arcobacteraceae bacterium]